MVLPKSFKTAPLEQVSAENKIQLATLTTASISLFIYIIFCFFSEFLDQTETWPGLQVNFKVNFHLSQHQ